MTTKYDDIGKEGLDFLSRGFPSNNGVKVNFENNFDGVEMKSTLERTLKDGKELVTFFFRTYFSISLFSFELEAQG